MKKIDFKKELKEYYNPSPKKAVVVTVPEMNFITLSGKGDPNTSIDFQNGIEALFSVSYNIKFAVKKGKLQVDYGVMPLEGLWWAMDMSKFSLEDKSDWIWKIMIMQPELITQEMFDEAVLAVKKKKALPSIDLLNMERIREGLTVQMMHIGPFSTEIETMKVMEELMEKECLIKEGKHHEIYLNDFRKVNPLKMKTILRQPVRRG